MIILAQESSVKIVSKERFCSHGLSSKELETKNLLYKPAMGSIFDFIEKIQLLLKNRTLFTAGRDLIQSTHMMFW